MARVKYTNTKETPLKWHRFLQFVGYPLSFAGHVYLLIGFFLELLRISNTAFLELAHILNLLDAPLVLTLILVYLLLQSYFIAKLWLSSFRWKKSSLYTTLLHLLLLTVFDGAAMYYIYHNNLYILIGMNLHVYSNYTLPSRIILLLIVLLFIAVLMYGVLSFFYYLARRRLYRKSIVTPEAVQENVEEVQTEHPILLPEAQQEAETVEVVEVVEAPVEEEPMQESEEQKEETIEEETNDTEIVSDLVLEEPLQEEEPKEETKMVDILAQPMEEESVEETVTEAVEEKPVDEPVVEERPVEESKAVEEPVVVQENPVEEKVEEISIAEPEEAAVKRDVLFCKECGMKLKPNARFCSKCGHPIQS